MGQHRLATAGCDTAWSTPRRRRRLDLAAASDSAKNLGKRVSDRQGLEWMLSDCAEQLYITRLMVLHIAWKMEQGHDLRTVNSMAKTYIANMLCHVIDTANQIHGALGLTHDLPLVNWYAHARANRIIDGPDEVHR
jgi:acyl-CoA dehydrogenase